MASTSLSLGEHWESFIRGQVETGRYASATDVVRDALRVLELKSQQLEALRRHLDEGASEAETDNFRNEFSFEKLIGDLDGTARADATGSRRAPKRICV